MPPKKSQQNEMEEIRKSLSFMSEEISKGAKQLTHSAPDQTRYKLILTPDGSLLHVGSRRWCLDLTTSLAVEKLETSENPTHYSLFTNSRTVIQIINE